MLWNLFNLQYRIFVFFDLKLIMKSVYIYILLNHANVSDKNSNLCVTCVVEICQIQGGTGKAYLKIAFVPFLLSEHCRDLTLVIIIIF